MCYCKTYKYVIRLFVPVLLLVLVPSSTIQPAWHKHTWHSGALDWCSNNKKISIPLAAAIAAIGWDTTRLATGAHANKTWWQTAQASYKGLAGIAALPMLWALHRHYANQLEDYQESLFDTKIIHRTLKCVPQGFNADCGYHAIYNAMYLVKNDIAALTNEKAYNKNAHVWKKSVAKQRESRDSSHISLIDMEEAIISKHVPTLQATQKDDWIRQNVSVIDHVDSLQLMLEQNITTNVERHTIQNIKRFRTTKTPQIIILNTASGKEAYKRSWHWIVIRLTYIAPDVIEIATTDSLGWDNRHYPLLKKVHHLFTDFAW